MLITYKKLSLNQKSTYYYILCYFPIQFCVSLCIGCTGKRSGISVKGLRKFLSSEGICCLWIERAHRLNTRKSPRPVIVKFSHYKDKEKVLRTYREKVKELKENQHVNEDAAAQGQPSEASDDREPESLFGGVRVAEDFSARVRKARASLRPFLRDYLKNKQDAFIKFDKLVVDDVTYVYDEIEKKLVRE